MKHHATIHRNKRETIYGTLVQSFYQQQRSIFINLPHSKYYNNNFPHRTSTSSATAQPWSTWVLLTTTPTDDETGLCKRAYLLRLRYANRTQLTARLFFRLCALWCDQDCFNGSIIQDIKCSKIHYNIAIHTVYKIVKQ